MALKLITAAVDLAVTLAEAKLHLRVDGTDDDTLIQALIVAATESAEQATGRAIMPQTWELTLDLFPEAFELTRIPVVSVDSVTYQDATGAPTVLTSALYSLDNADDFGPAYVVPAYGTDWPETRDETNAVAVRYIAGYADSTLVPEPIKTWIKLQVGAMYENREGDVIERASAIRLPFVDRLLDRYRVWA